MRRNERLAVWLHRRRIAWLTGTSLRPRLEYLPDLVAEYGAGAALLSLSLPLQSKAINGPAVLNFFDGLLPEGQVRAHLAEARSGVTGILVAAAEAHTSVPQRLAHLPALVAARAEDLIAGSTARRQL